MAGPCSAESEQQLLDTAAALKTAHVHLFRAGLWKPRTRPDTFSGVGEEGLAWLRRVKAEYGFPVATEAAKASHVDAILEAGIDAIWLGARTTVNPFSVQEIADALKGTGMPVIVKNPINPDLQLWIGAIERLYKAGIDDIALIHRGFSYFDGGKYRNNPMWQIPIEIKLLHPELPLLCDISHISGNRVLLNELAQQALDLQFDGLMVEVHPSPDQALSDKEQQITPDELIGILSALVLRRTDPEDLPLKENIEYLRSRIDDLDDELLEILSRRMHIVEDIGLVKREHRIPILQPDRWHAILQRALDIAREASLSAEFIEILFKAIHQESIDHQTKVMNVLPEQKSLTKESE